MTESCSHFVYVQVGPPSLHYCCAVVLRSSIVLPPVSHSSNHEYHCCQLTGQSSGVSNFYHTFKFFIWLTYVFTCKTWSSTCVIKSNSGKNMNCLVRNCSYFYVGRTVKIYLYFVAKIMCYRLMLIINWLSITKRRKTRTVAKPSTGTVILRSVRGLGGVMAACGVKRHSTKILLGKNRVMLTWVFMDAPLHTIKYVQFCTLC